MIHNFINDTLGIMTAQLAVILGLFLIRLTFEKTEFKPGIKLMNYLFPVKDAK